MKNQKFTLADSEIVPESEAAVAGFVRDYISGAQVRATPEEVDAVQVLARRLVEDYGYKKEQIQTHPQFRVRRSPSDEAKSYPIDIAVFRGKKHVEDELLIVAECKKRNRKDGITQLKLYLDMSPAEIGVWFNGDDHAYLRKVHQKNGRVTHPDLPTIPRAGQRIEDIGRFRRADLRAPSNLKAVFRDIRNHLAGNMTGITRDETLASEIINLLFCKIYDELNTAPEDAVLFRCGVDESPAEIKKRIVDLFEKRVKKEYADVFSARDAISLDAASLVYVVGELQSYCIVDADRDAVGDAFEVFIGPALRGSEGQFFTPRNAVRLIVSMLDPKPGEMIIDPACGSGGFLIATLEHVWKHLEEEAKRKKWSEVQLDRKRRDVASKCFRGLDKDSFLAKVTKAYMAIMGDGRGGVFCENSLLPSVEWHSSTQSSIELGTFDVVLTNPPFGSKIAVKGASTLSQYDLGHKWKKTNESRDDVRATFSRLDDLRDEQTPHILFVDRCLQLLKPGGRLGIVLPESILGNPSYEYLVSYLMERTTVRAVVTLPESLFKTSGKGGTHTKVCVLFLEKTPPAEPYDIFMADAKWCGHDSRGNPTLRPNAAGEMVLLDEIPEIALRYREIVGRGSSIRDHRGFLLRSDSLTSRVLVPKYYDPEIAAYLAKLSRTHELIRLGDLARDGVLTMSTGAEVGKMAYGTGPIPFIRTSDFSNWEIKADFKHGVSDAVYASFRSSCDVEAGDILIVRDGTYLIGTTAIVTASDLPMLFQSHILRIRIRRPDVIDPWLLFACLNTPVVKRQIRAKQFTQDIIDTLGRRLFEVYVPVPRDARSRRSIAEEVRNTVEMRVRLRNRTRELSLEVEGIDPARVNLVALDEEIEA
jgi:type I restriction enzyme M protein